MHARFALLAGSALSLIAVVHCAQRAKQPEVADAPAAAPDASVDAGEGGAGGAPDKEPETPRPDPALVQKALDRTGAPAAHGDHAHGLRFEVVEIGPNAPWGFAVVNRGTETMSVVFDPRLLALEVQAPHDPKAKRPPKPRVCRLPEELRPARADLGYPQQLAPGQGIVEAFDPRLYCLPEQGVSPLVAGARVSATLGWPRKTKLVWRRGKRIEEVPPQVPPFVATVAAPADADGGVAAPLDGGPGPDAGDAGPSGEIVMTDRGSAPVVAELGIKELRATPFELGGDYAPPAKTPSAGLAFALTQGSDAATASSATVTAKLSNHGSTTERVFFRRELVSLEVSSVDGTTPCEPEPDDRSPDRQAFTALAPGGSISVTSRLAEVCPQETFSRPGLYLVRGAFRATIDGSEFGLEAFVGELSAERPAVVRIRKGERPFPGHRVLQEVQVGAAPNHPNP
jgi:hypothetical protein